MRNRNMKYGSLLVLFASALSFAQQATGYVYEDTNGNRRRDRREKGIAQVAVSNGEEVVLTDQYGKYTIPVKDNQSVFVIKPKGYKTPVNENNLPQFYYHYRPEGSPNSYEYKGIAPTGKIPSEISFPLIPQQENSRFRIMVFGDPQPYDEKELDYFRRGIVNEAKNNKQDAVLGISLGDLVGNDLSLQPKYAAVMKEMGLPWYNVMGNHDMNYEAREDQFSDETFRANFGPNTYAFNYADVHFIVLDDILYPDPRDGKGYWGGFREDQLKFVENDLKYVDRNKLVVVAFHIPLIHNEDDFRETDRQRLIRLLGAFPNVLMMSAHTHIQQQIFYSKKDGWTQPVPLHEYNAGTTCGDWYSGTADETGVPQSTMRDGTERGYSHILFDGNRYDIRYKVAGKAENYQIGLYVPKAIPDKGWNTAKILANFFMGSAKDSVLYRIDDGDWKKMTYNETMDPAYAVSVYKWDQASELFPGRRPSDPQLSKHIWTAGFPKKLTLGKHTVDVKATDMFGKEYTATSSFEVREKVYVP